MATKAHYRTVIHFLANVDESILGVEFNNDIKVSKMTPHEAVMLMVKYKLAANDFYAAKEFPSDCVGTDEDSCYLIIMEKQVDPRKQKDEHAPDKDSPSYITVSYLIPTINQLKLYKEGNIAIIRSYQFTRDENYERVELFFTRTGKSVGLEIISGIKENIFSVEDNEKDSVNYFIKTMPLDFEDDVFRMAYRMLLQSYEINDKLLSFILLMTGMEILFIKDHDIKANKNIAKRAANLLGKSISECNKIDSELRRLYKVRCEIVHSGTSKSMKERDKYLMRDFLRKSIVKLYKSGMTKKKYIDVLHKAKSGSNPILG